MSARRLPHSAPRVVAACATLLVLAAGCRDSTAVGGGGGETASRREQVVSAASVPTSVTVAGSFQSEAGCSGDWQPACATTHLAYDANDDVWQASFALPAGSYEYKAALNDGWDENYGLNATQNGANIPLALAASGSVKFYYDPVTHWITDDVNAVIATAAGSFQSEVGCSGDWDPSCLRSWLEDTDGDGVYVFSTDLIPAGAYEVKVAISESWNENYGAGGTPGGANIPFTVVQAGSTVAFSYVAATHLLTVTVTPPTPLAQTITFTSTAPNPGYVGGSYAVSATATSGLAVTFSSLTSSVCTVSGSTVSFVAIGTCTVAADQAGDATYAAAPQATQSIDVDWAFTGFLSPVANPPALNEATAGATVRVRFSLGGNQGLAIFAAGSPSSAPLDCPAGANLAIISVAGTGRQSTLSYNASSGVYTYSWVTNRSWANGCRTLTVVLADGSTHEAYFHFR